MGRRRRGPLNLPGPAHYAYDDKLYRTGRYIGPHYSLKGRFDHPPSDTPGPGHYNPQDIFKSVSYTINRRPKGLKNRFRPGPADYFIPAHLLRTGKVMGNKHTIPPRREEPKNENPDPAQYNPSDNNKPQQVTILEKPKEAQPPVGPTATTYEIDPNISKDGTHNPQTHTIGVRRSNKALSKVPPPGTYNPKHPPDQRRIIFRKGRLDFPIDDNPGPGTYNVKKTFVDTNGFSIRKRIPSPADDGVGPGQYSYPADLIRTGRANIRNSMIHGRLKSDPGNHVPSPTRYTVGSAVMRRTKKTLPSYSFPPHGERTFGNTPAPGAYNTIREVPLKTFTYKPGLSERNSYIPKNTNPSPTKYEINDELFDKIRKAKPTFTLKGRSDDVLGSDAPGPGTYMQDLDRYGVGGKGLSKVFEMGKKVKHPDYKFSPGPVYDPDPMIGKTIRSTKPTRPQYTFGQKCDTTEMDFVQTPGPGTYPVVDLRKTPTGWVRTGPN